MHHKNNRLWVVDSFRGICSVFVVFYHSHFFGGITQSEFFKNSDVFVDFFFVLSGFVMAFVYWNNKEVCFVDFIKARIIRIYPLHLFMFFMFFVLEFIKLFALKHHFIKLNVLPFSGPNAPIEMIGNLLLIQSWISALHYNSLNYTSWSISIELYLYVLSALLILPRVFDKIFLCCCRGYVLIPVVVFLLGVYIYALKLGDSFYIRIANGFFCYFLGVLGFLIRDGGQAIVNKAHRNVSTAVEIILVISVYFFVINKESLHQVLFPFLSLIVILCFSFELGLISDFLKINLFKKIGQLSYSIYLVHPFVLFFYVTVVCVVDKFTSMQLVVFVDNERMLIPSFLNNLLFLFVLSSVFCFSFLTNKFVEIRFSRYLWWKLNSCSQ